MLLNLLRAITDFAVLVARFTTGEFADEQLMVLIDQFMRLQGFDAAFEFDLHDLSFAKTRFICVFNNFAFLSTQPKISRSKFDPGVEVSLITAG